MSSKKKTQKAQTPKTSRPVEAFDPTKTREATKEDEEKTVMWAAVATIIGLNDLATKAKVLGEKVYFRLARDHVYQDYLAKGGKAFLTENEQPILTLDVPAERPHVAFRPRDIELMRETVAAYDALHPKGKP